jgi:hypothetical protein
MQFKNSKKAVAAFVVTAIGMVAGIGFATWTSDGDGQGRARAVTAQPVTVTAVSGPADLFPGALDGDVHFTLTNPNPYDVVFEAMTPGEITSSNQVNCSAANIDVVGAGGLSLPVAAGDTSDPLSIADVVSMDADAPEACQGVSFDIDLVLAGTSD